MMLLESEIDLLKFTFLRTNHFSNNNQSNIPKVYFIPNSRKGLGIDSMGELAVSFELSGQKSWWTFLIKSSSFVQSESKLIHFFESRFLDESKLIHSGAYTNLYAYPL